SEGRSCGHLTVIFSAQLSSRDFPHRFSTRSCGHLTTNDVGSEGRSCGHLTVIFSAQLSSRDFPHVRAVI
ncbi:10222_t:CDS:2, partial [Acaulospora morrowiae]